MSSHLPECPSVIFPPQEKSLVISSVSRYKMADSPKKIPEARYYKVTIVGVIIGLIVAIVSTVANSISAWYARRAYLYVLCLALSRSLPHSSLFLFSPHRCITRTMNSRYIAIRSVARHWRRRPTAPTPPPPPPLKIPRSGTSCRLGKACGI